MIQGKRDELSLQEKEKQIRRGIKDTIIPCSGEITVLDLVKKHLSQKTSGRQRIDKVKLSDAPSAG